VSAHCVTKILNEMFFYIYNFQLNISNDVFVSFTRAQL